VFGILERGGKVRIEVIQNVTGETLLTMAIKKVKRGSLITPINSGVITVSSHTDSVI
jgi:hypothetical protein